MLTKENESRNMIIIWVLSILIPVVVALLMFLPTRGGANASWVYALPHLNSILNSSTVVILISGYLFIRKGHVQYHKTCMSVAFVLGTMFLISYLIYHSSAPSTVYGDINGDGQLDAAEKTALGSLRTIYLVVLLSHILLAIVVVPFVLLTFYYALTSRIEKHRRIVRFTLPIWLYVSVSGVAVYLMISPYYQ